LATLSLRRLTKRFGGVEAVRGIDLDVADREFVVLVGPSGGEIAIDGAVVNEREPKDRDIAMVFQDYALYPHMTVAQNMGFALRYRGASKAEIRERVDPAARLLEIEPPLKLAPAG
jgi:ABC-type sugar transport system ATPase subunit